MIFIVFCLQAIILMLSDAIPLMTCVPNYLAMVFCTSLFIPTIDRLASAFVPENDVIAEIAAFIMIPLVFALCIALVIVISKCVRGIVNYLWYLMSRRPRSIKREALHL